MLTQINATEECERANGFPTIRLFTVGDDNPGRAFNHGGPEHDLQNVIQPWVQAANTSLCHKDNATSYVSIPPRVSPNWHGGDFSAMCVSSWNSLDSSPWSRLRPSPTARSLALCLCWP